VHDADNRSFVGVDDVTDCAISMVVHWWLSMPQTSTIQSFLNMTQTSVPATLPLAALLISEGEGPECFL
jgi:hypothetical protein